MLTGRTIICIAMTTASGLYFESEVRSAFDDGSHLSCCLGVGHSFWGDIDGEIVGADIFLLIMAFVWKGDKFGVV